MIHFNYNYCLQLLVSALPWLKGKHHLPLSIFFLITGSVSQNFIYKAFPIWAWSSRSSTTQWPFLWFLPSRSLALFVMHHWDVSQADFEKAGWYILCSFLQDFQEAISKNKIKIKRWAKEIPPICCSLWELWKCIWPLPYCSLLSGHHNW